MNREDIVDYLKDCAVAIAFCAAGGMILACAFVGACGLLAWERVCR